MFNFPLTKSLQQRKTARHCKSPMKSKFVCNGSYVCCFYKIYRKERLLVETLYVSYISWNSFSTCLH